MKKNVISKILAGALAASMVVGMAACGNGDTNPSGSNESGSGSGSESGSEQASGNSGSSDESGSSQGEEQLPPMKLTISLPTMNTDHAVTDSTYDRLTGEINEYLNSDITWQWEEQSTYYGRLGLKYAANDVADVLVVGLDASFYSAATGGTFDALLYDENGEPVMEDKLDEEGNPVKDEEGNVVQVQKTETQTMAEPIFWDLTDYLDDYDNLATISDSSRADTSYKGRVYAIPRSRPAARNGIGYRQDWLNKLNLKEPETWDDFTAMLYAFTYNDPDGNGEDDTVGLGIDQWTGVWDHMMTWFGVPNTWGLDDNGDLIYKAMTPEYKTALKAFRELFADGVVNDGSQKGIPSWEDIGGGGARKELFNTGKAGVNVQVLDDSRKVETYFQDNNLYGAVKGTMDPDELIFMLQSYVLTESGGMEPHILNAGSASNGIAISKTGNVKTEEDLRRVLQIINDMNDGEFMNLVEYGWEGVTYELDEDGYVSLWMGNSENDEDGTRAKLDAAGVGSLDYRDGFNQIIPYFTAEANARPVDRAPAGTAINILENQLKSGPENQPYVVMNLGAGYSSEYYLLNGAALDKIITEAQAAYIAGEIDDTALQTALDQWWTAGGEQVTKEMNEQYHAAGN